MSLSFRVTQAALSLGILLSPSLLFSQAVPFSDTSQAANAEAASPAATTAASFTVYPSTAAVRTGMHQTFQGQLSSVPDKNRVTFAVDGQAGGSSTKGVVSSTGVYTAPTTPGIHTLTATDTYTHQTASSRITVYSKVVVDFGSRSNLLHAIPSAMFGAEHFDSLHSQSDIDMVVRAGITYARFYAELPAVFPTAASVSAPQWQKVDHNFQNIGVTGGVHIMVQMTQTPAWLARSGVCTTAPTTSMPSNVNTWAKLAALYVAHMDQKFPGIVTDYEIWNEPNTGAFCDPGRNALTDYQALYAAAAPLMKAQAARDRKTIRIGGPAGAGLVTSWVQALTTNPKTAPYV
ncbi:MAG: polysaccharide biosynthesis protein PslG, partial [Acidobacteriaceae bacterium]|nr:polysaccharide biosynthesis protein PslG [Acidobacteriaceae bacterium]